MFPQMDPQALYAMLMNADPAQLDQAATMMAAQGAPPPPPGTMQQAAGMLAQQGMGGFQAGPPGQGPMPLAENASLGSILGAGPVADPMTQAANQMLQAQPTGAPGQMELAQPQEDPQARMQRMMQAMALMQNQERQQERTPYLTNVTSGSAQLAQPLQIPGRLTPPGGGIPALGQYL